MGKAQWWHRVCEVELPVRARRTQGAEPRAAARRQWRRGDAGGPEARRRGAGAREVDLKFNGSEAFTALPLEIEYEATVLSTYSYTRKKGSVHVGRVPLASPDSGSPPPPPPLDA